MLVSAVGFLNVPRYPDWPGLDDFARREVPHRALGARARPRPARSSRWSGRVRRPRRSCPRSSRSCSSCTCSSASRAGSCRRASATSPPKSGPRSRSRWRAGGNAGGRSTCSRRASGAGTSTGPGRRPTRRAAQFCLSYIERHFAEHPDLRDAVTPRYPYPGQAADLREHVLSRAEEGQRGARAARGRRR